MPQIKLSWTNPWLYLHLRGFRVWPCWVWLSVTKITLRVEELTDGDSNWGILVWSISEGQNIQIKLLVPRAILSETVAVSSVFMAGLSEWMKAHCQLREGVVPNTCFMRLRCPGHSTLHKLQHELFPEWMPAWRRQKCPDHSKQSELWFSPNLSQDFHWILRTIYLNRGLRALFHQISFKFPW